MTKKLFALESDEKASDGEELLIDKVLNKQEKEKPGMMLTAELIKKRHELKKEISDEITKTSGDTDASGDESEEPGESSEQGDDETEGEAQEGAADKDNESEDADPDESKDSDEKEADNKSADASSDEEEDDVEVASDKDSLNSVVGSALDSGNKEPKKDSKEATESFKSSAAAKQEPLFLGVTKVHDRYSLALEGLESLPPKVKPKEQPVVYVKEEVLKGLDALLKLSARYVANNNKRVDSIKAGLLKLSEANTIYSEYNDAGKLKLTMKILDSEELLKETAMPGVSALKTTSFTLDKYMTALSGCFTKLASNDLSSLKTVFTSSGFTEKEGILVMDKILPGFNRLNVAMVEYTDYLSVNYEDYQVYANKVFKVQDLYNLGGVSLDSDTDLKTALKSFGGIVVHVGLFVDNLSDLSKSYNELIDSLKALHYDVETDKVKNLAELDIDSKLKDFIKFKMLSEGYSASVDICMGFMTSANTAMSSLVELAESNSQD